MKLKKLEIDRFKNLRNFTIDFGQSQRTVLLGQNGTGKSHVLEALIIIFRDLDVGAEPLFEYKLDYNCRGNDIHIDADPKRGKDEKVIVSLKSSDGNHRFISYRHFYEDYANGSPLYLPSYVFSYYSGFSTRMENLFNKHREGIYRDILRGPLTLSRSLLYALPAYGQLALLIFFIEENQEVLRFLDQQFGIQGIASLLFVMQQPTWKGEGSDSRFWHTSGITHHLLSDLYELAFAPMRLNVPVDPELIHEKAREHLYIYLRDVEDLQKLVKRYSNSQEFFKALESLFISRILNEVRIRLKMGIAASSMTFQDLSEGEQQLLIVLGLLRFTRQDEALFLLDEPDTHLNPAWSIQYLDFMRQIVGDQPTSHVLMTTHNPLVISSLERDEVRIMQRDEANKNIYVKLPQEKPKGMGVAGILTSDLFELRSTLDLPTQEDLDKRRELAVKEGDLSDDDAQKLAELNERLAGLDFSITIRDPLYRSFASEYRDFVRNFILRAQPDLKQGIVFTPEQRQRQRELTRQILREIKEQRGQQI